MHSRSLFFLLFTALILASIGCDGNVKVRGKVTHSDDQSPLTVGQIRFQTDTILARGTLKPDGTYVLGTVTEKDGIPKGTYTVTFTDVHELVYPENVAPGALAMPSMRPLIAHFEKTVVIDGKQKVFDFTVDRAK